MNLKRLKSNECSTGSSCTSPRATHAHNTHQFLFKGCLWEREIYHWALLHLMLFRTTIETMRPWPIRSEHKTKQKSKDFHHVNDNRKANECILEASGVPETAEGEAHCICNCWAQQCILHSVTKQHFVVVLTQTSLFQIGMLPQLFSVVNEHKNQSKQSMGRRRMVLRP